MLWSVVTEGQPAWTTDTLGQSLILLSVGHGHLCKQAPATAASKQKTLVEQSPELLAGKGPALHLGSVGSRALWGLGIQHQLSCGGREGELWHPGGRGV